jgi:hypothetical protein
MFEQEDVVEQVTAVRKRSKEGLERQRLLYAIKTGKTCVDDVVDVGEMEIRNVALSNSIASQQLIKRQRTTLQKEARSNEMALRRVLGIEDFEAVRFAKSEKWKISVAETKVKNKAKEAKRQRERYKVIREKIEAGIVVKGPSKAYVQRDDSLATKTLRNANKRIKRLKEKEDEKRILLADLDLEIQIANSLKLDPTDEKLKSWLKVPLPDMKNWLVEFGGYTTLGLESNCFFLRVHFGS